MTTTDLGERELDLMQALWALGEPATVAEVQGRLEARGETVAYNTVQTMLNRLSRKGLVRRWKEGRAYRYAAAVAEGEVAGSAVGRVLRRFFRGSPERLAAHLVEEELEDAEIERLAARIRDHRERGRTPDDRGDGEPTS